MAVSDIESGELDTTPELNCHNPVYLLIETTIKILNNFFHHVLDFQVDFINLVKFSKIMNFSMTVCLLRYTKNPSTT
jgi:hypothetical protein